MNDDRNNVIEPKRSDAQTAALRARANWEYIATENRDLRKTWYSLIGHFNAPDVPGDWESTPASHWFASLETAYQSGDRHYHNLEHVGQMLTWIYSSWDDTWESCLI